MMKATVNPKMEPIPDYADHMTLEDFYSCVEQGAFIDYDGFGYLATKDEMSDILVKPSYLKHPDAKWLIENISQMTHVVWFNR